ncbi:NUDIX domain-containing protein [Streptomyces sp. NPDC048604]|uniref:NUDIX hydrolase n=1 Tax=Streptomyces sp. NPDC048604 TaxID=3365578 RepID=UPI00371369E8
MPPSHSRVHSLITAHLDGSPEVPASQVTYRAAVIDRERRVLHVRDGAAGRPVVPGGPVAAADATPLASALRALQARTGLEPGSLSLTDVYRDEPVDVAVDPTTGAEVHFVLCLATGVPAEAAEGAVWLPYDEVASPTLRALLERDDPDGRVVPVNTSALIHDGHGRYLLQLRDANKPWIWEPGAWGLLGGGREPQDASLLDTMHRELLEEAELDIPDLVPYAVEDVVGVDGVRLAVQVYAGRWNGDAASLPLTEGVMLAWVRPEKFPDMTMPRSTRELLLEHARNTPATPAPVRRVPHIVGAHLYLEREDGAVLLGLRHPDSAYAGGRWHFPAGHCEQESATACLVREAYEEAGLVIDPDDVELVHTVHLRHAPGTTPRIQLVFRARRWEGVPELREPDKCVAWQWWDPEALPEAIVPYARAAVEGVRSGRAYSESGWSR